MNHIILTKSIEWGNYEWHCIIKVNGMGQLKMTLYDQIQWNG